MDEHNIRVKAATKLLIKYLLENHRILQQVKQGMVLVDGQQGEEPLAAKEELMSNSRPNFGDTSPTLS